MNDVNFAALVRATLPETALEVAALLVLVVDLGFLRKASLQLRTAAAAVLGIVGCAAALWAVSTAGPYSAALARKSLAITGAPLSGLPPLTMALGPSISMSAPRRGRCSALRSA